MPVTAGKRIGSYEIVSAIGKGGMGEVYRARDTRLDRHVAIKTLPEEFENDPDRLARFEREAKTLASLNHPNIAAIYGLEQYEGSHVLVLELVEGATLADQLKRGALPLEDSLKIALQITEALEAAHEKGIIHRDLKPANIKVTPDGKVKVLDFGLAKAMSEPAQDVNLSDSPTISVAATQHGVILGTAAYMSPEQARGKAIDNRTDIWAFGCVIFEMLTGQAAFEGETISDVISAVLRASPDWTRMPAETPEAIRQLLHRCIEKDRKERLPHIGSARIEIREALSGRQMDVPVAQRVTARSNRVWLSVSILMTIIAAIAIALALRPSPQPPERRLEIMTPPTTEVTSFAIAPNGQAIVFEAISDGAPKLWLRPLDSVSHRPIPGTDGGTAPFWSPDSRSIGFFADGKLKRVDIDGSSLQTLANIARPAGGAWNREGVILYSPAPGRGLWRVSALGGEPAAVTELETSQAGHFAPQFLPDGSHFLYYATSRSVEEQGVHIGELGGKESRRLIAAVGGAVYTSGGYLLFVRQGTLFAQSFDPSRMTLTGNPSAIAADLAHAAVITRISAFAAAAGLVAYRSSGEDLVQSLAWFDRSGKEIKRIDAADRTRSLSISPGGRLVALSREVNVGSADIWLLDIVRDLVTKFTFGSGGAAPTWSPDGKTVIFSRTGTLYLKSASGDGREEVLPTPPGVKSPTDWSPDGRLVLYRMPGPKSDYDLWALPVDRLQKPFPVLQTQADERDGQFSPDGKWLAYQSNESGGQEIYVQSFPGPGRKSQVSNGGGTQVRWRRDGKELFYVSSDLRMMSVSVRVASNDFLELGAPTPLFQTRLTSTAGLSGGRQQYDVSSDGQQFLMNTYADTGNQVGTSPITVILNWKPKP